MVDLKPRVRKEKRSLKPEEEHSLPPKSLLRPEYQRKRKVVTEPTSITNVCEINFGFDDDFECLDSGSDGDFETGFPVDDYGDDLPEDILYNAARKYNDEEETKDEDEDEGEANQESTKEYVILFCRKL